MKKRLLKIILIDVSIGLALVGYYFVNRFLGIGIPCVFHQITGLLCPGCGITRCLFAILQLDFETAFYSNQFVFILLPIALIYCGLWQYLYIKNQLDKIPKRLVNIACLVLAVVALVFGVVRNF